MQNIRFDIRCEQNETERLIAGIGKLENCVLKDFHPANETSHNVVYKYTVGGDKVSIVYDTKARQLSVTAPEPLAKKLRSLCDQTEKTQPAGGKQPQGTQKKDKAQALPIQKQAKQKRENKKSDTVLAKEKTQASRGRFTEPKTRIEQASDRIADTKNAKQDEPEGASVTVKKVSGQRFEEILKGLKRIKGVSCRLERTAGSGEEEVKTYRIDDGQKQRLKLRFMTHKGILQLQGKRSKLFGEVQVLLNRGDNYASAVKNYIAVAGEDKRAADVQKMLKKRLPDAYEYLSEQSKIDITIGLIDIYNHETRLADYSSLLTPPYRGLEKFVSDLQKAQGIEVKMIGQAFDKPDGKYELKNGYKKRIKSVIYAEVLVALYTEYFARRNFYTHSDNSDESAPRIITDKSEVLAIFDRLLDTINYNCKKLKEIGFSVGG